MKITVLNALLSQSCSGKCYEGNQLRHLVFSINNGDNKLKHWALSFNFRQDCAIICHSGVIIIILSIKRCR